MGEIDGRGRLADEAYFSYQATKAGKVMIFWYEKLAVTLKDADARKFLAQVQDVSEFDAQLVMAKWTGNFKRGNERRK